MKITYDFEFLEDGNTIEPISVGMVREDGVEYYAIFEEAPWDRIYQHKWLRSNVLPYLPKHSNNSHGHWRPDPDSSLVRPTRVIRNEVREMILGPDRKPELWAYYAAYDHVALCRLWGTMMDLPPEIPMFTRDLKQEQERLGLTKHDPGYPGEGGMSLHKAIDDARWNMRLLQYLEKTAEEEGRV
ncbi:3'-5' exoribonuclease domain-containing protein [Streptomyces sp. NPDC002248]